MSDLPSATLVEVPPEGQIVATAPANVAVYFFCSSKGPLSTPTPFGSQQQALSETVFGCGGVREMGYCQAKVPVPCVGIRLPKTSTPGTKSTPVITADATSTWTAALTGTPTDGLDVVLTFTIGGTTGSAGIKYTLSTDGGFTTGPEVALGTATSITIGGVAIALGTAKLVVATDFATWWTEPPSATILPATVTRVGSSTSTMVFSGSPEDGYEIGIYFVTGGTVGAPGITFQYALDAGAATPKLSKVLALPLNGIFPIPDGKDASGVTLTVGAGTVDALDGVTARTTPPAYQWADAAAALDTLRNSKITWSFLVFTSFNTRAFRDSAESKLQDFAGSGRFTWAACPGRDRITGENTTSDGNVLGDLAWSGRIEDEWSGSIGNRTPPQWGAERVTCPLTGRRNRRPVTVANIPRNIGITPDTDIGDRTLPNGGALSADISIHNDITGALEEHDARINPSLFQLGGNVLRTWYGEQGLEPGVFPAGGRLMSADTDIQRWQHRRVQDLADAAALAAMSRQVLRKFGVWPQTARAPYVSGDIMPWDMTNIQQILFAAVYAAVGAYVSAPKTGGITIIVEPTPGQVNGNTVVYQKTKLVSRKYLDTFSGTLGFVDPAFAGLFQAAS